MGDIESLQDKQQRVNSYISFAQIKVYYIEQYNKLCNEWFIIGDCSESPQKIKAIVDLHNSQLLLFEKLNNINSYNKKS